MKRSTTALPLAAALLVGACMGGTDPASAPDDEGAWMDDAMVVVSRDEAAGRETVTLVAASGFSQVIGDEPLTQDLVEAEDPGDVGAAIAARTHYK
jgi:hypothetical protein